MPANLKDPFGAGCCDGGECGTSKESAMTCGCDPGMNYISPNCWKHNEVTLMKDSDLEIARIDNEMYPQPTTKHNDYSTPEIGKINNTPKGPSPYPKTEVRMVDPKTGGEKGVKIDRYDLIPHEFEDALATHYGVGARKYADRNWERGYNWGYSYRALRSHLNRWLRGEKYDDETGTHHLICVIWHAIALYTFEIRGLGTNDLTRNPK